MNSLKLIHEQRRVRAKVIKVDKLHGETLCQCLDTGSQFLIDEMVSMKERKLKPDEVFEAMVHPCQVVFAVMDYLDQETK